MRPRRARARYAVEKQPLDAPYFDLRRADLTLDGASAGLIPQAIVVPTGMSHAHRESNLVTLGIVSGGDTALAPVSRSERKHVAQH